MEVRTVASLLKGETRWEDLHKPSNVEQYRSNVSEMIQESQRNFPNGKTFPSWDPYPILPP